MMVYIQCRECNEKTFVSEYTDYNTNFSHCPNCGSEFNWQKIFIKTMVWQWTKGKGVPQSIKDDATVLLKQIEDDPDSIRYIP